MFKLNLTLKYLFVAGLFIALPLVFNLTVSLAVATEGDSQTEGDLNSLSTQLMVNSLVEPGRGIAFHAADEVPKPLSQRVPLYLQFEVNSYELTDQATHQMEQLLGALRHEQLKNYIFSIQGHTDSTGRAEYNRELSMKRALAVKNYLSQKGVADHRLQAIGLGEDFPLAGLDPKNEKNRRVEIVNIASVEAVEAVDDRRKRALLIGVDQYSDQTGTIGSLKGGPIEDVKLMVSLLRDQLGFAERDIKVLTDEQATRENILTAMQKWLIDATSQGDEVFFYFSGHGFQQRDENGDETDKLDETLIPYDAQVFVKSANDRLLRNVIKDDEMDQLINQMSDRTVQVVIDSCHSGTVTKGIGFGSDDGSQFVKTISRHEFPEIPRGQATDSDVRADGEDIIHPSDSTISNTNLSVWSAVKANQSALVEENQEDGNVLGSVFTLRLLSGLRERMADQNNDNRITKQELYDWVLQESEDYCNGLPDQIRLERCETGLTPQLLTHRNNMDGLAFTTAAASANSSAVMTKDILFSQANNLRYDPAAYEDSNVSSVELKIMPSTKLKVGTKGWLEITSKYSGNLALYDINSAGKLVQLFPNEYSIAQDIPSHIESGEKMRLPSNNGKFEAVPPLGKSKLLVIVSNSNEKLSTLASLSKDINVQPVAYLTELGEAMRTSNDNIENNLIVATFDYEIVE